MISTACPPEVSSRAAVNASSAARAAAGSATPREQAVRRDPAPGVGGRVAVAGGGADPDQAEEDLPGGRPPGLVEPGVDVLGRPGDRARDPARRLVARDASADCRHGTARSRAGHGPAAGADPARSRRRAPLPVRARVAAPAFRPSPRAPSSTPRSRSSRSVSPASSVRPTARAGRMIALPHLGGRHRAEHHLPGLHRLAQHRVRGRPGVEVGPHAEYDQGAARARVGGQGPDLIEEPGALRLRLAQREDLLKLVDDHDECERRRRRSATFARVASAARSVRSGWDPGVIIRRGHPAEPGAGSRPSARAFSSPAPSSEDLPVPDGATTSSGPPGPPRAISSR